MLAEKTAPHFKTVWKENIRQSRAGISYTTYVPVRELASMPLLGPTRSKRRTDAREKLRLLRNLGKLQELLDSKTLQPKKERGVMRYMKTLIEKLKALN